MTKKYLAIPLLLLLTNAYADNADKGLYVGVGGGINLQTTNSQNSGFCRKAALLAELRR